MINWKPTLDQARLRWLIDYNPATGVFRWRIGTRPIPAGSLAGNRRPDGRLVICVDNQEYQAGRLAWFYVKGEWPVGDIDHRDCDPSNNRFDNLRIATPSQNMANCGLQRNNTTGYKGVFRQGRRYSARIKVNGTQIRLGTFSSPSEAAKAYDAAAVEHFGEFARTNAERELV